MGYSAHLKNLQKVLEAQFLPQCVSYLVIISCEEDPSFPGTVTSAQWLTCHLLWKLSHHVCPLFILIPGAKGEEDIVYRQIRLIDIDIERYK